MSTNIRLCRVLTDRGTEYCGNPERHEYELYLAVEEVDRSRTRTKRPQRHGIAKTAVELTGGLTVIAGVRLKDTETAIAKVEAEAERHPLACRWSGYTPDLAFRRERFLDVIPTFPPNKKSCVIEFVHHGINLLKSDDTAMRPGSSEGTSPPIP